MKFLLSATAVCILSVMCSCSEKAHTDSVIHAEIDSLVGVKTEEINAKAMEDLDRRMAVEVKPKADSIVRVRMMKGTVKHH